MADGQKLATAYGTAASTVRAALIAYLLGLWHTLPDQRDASAKRFIGLAAPAVAGAQLKVGQLTASYLSLLLAGQTGKAAAPVPVRPADVANLRGVTPAMLYQRPFTQVYTELSKGVPYETAVERGRARLVDVASTDVQLAKTHTAKRVLAAEPRIAGYRRVLTGSENCGLCVLASTQVYHREELLPIHPGCVPAGSLVTASGVRAVSRRWYEGELVVITTASGDEVSVTPNHPVLTDRGWIPAQLIGQGDNVVRHRRGHRVVDGRPGEDERPSPIEDVWRAASVARLLRMPLAAEDFHADGAHGEVEIVWTDGDLSPVRGVTFDQPVREELLVPGHGRRPAFTGGGVLAPLGERGFAAHAGRIGGGSLGGAFGGAHLAGAVEAGAATSARFDAPREEFSPESAPRYARQGLDLIGRLAGLVETDCVVQLRRVGWSGHVYNLHTAEGWYTSDSHIVSNCDCSVDPLFGDTKPAQVLDRELLDAAHAAIAERFGKFDAGGRAPDYRKVILVQQHGEIGPLLTVKGQHFDGPDDLTGTGS